MNVYVKIRLDQIDTEGPKGEELDEALEDGITSAIEGIDIEGREVSQVSIERENPKKKGNDSPQFQIGQSLASIAGITIENVQYLPQLEDKCPMNDKYTWREMLVYWGQELMKAESSHNREEDEALKKRRSKKRLG
jgi:hypothetical protein